MSIFDLGALVITVTALFSYLNYRFLKQPMTIGIMCFGNWWMRCSTQFCSR